MSRSPERFHPSPQHATLRDGTAARRFSTHSEEATRAFGTRLARVLIGGELIGLSGELGAGKTCLVRGIAEGLSIAPHKVRSPTFTLVNEYSGGRLPLYHIDLYRLSPTGVDRMALREYLYGDGVCVVEWFERLGEDTPHLGVQLTFVGENERLFVVTAGGERYVEVLSQLEER
jgi:tRNA threonylcarbamoyladenosine biosynthesis protein TsaE